ncbi:hypothetical protein BTM25_26780 [Actinomadura rubteroloni]|uniref:Uncharacterized protein n=1 Tax=Actinomadura rubteroloni TaxID=1926885 RepID=A0A2P4UG73_9ACTN|nr:hypothetical protein [Actinomadura rubteroloni]POM24051.1 hypothetical protein BTM25_26780 [Actinomadura rubteroloni]
MSIVQAADQEPQPANQRTTFLAALSLTLRERYPDVTCQISRFKAQLPPTLRVEWRAHHVDVGCDLTYEGWSLVVGFDPRKVIGPAGHPVPAARAVAELLGISRHPDY